MLSSPSQVAPALASESVQAIVAAGRSIHDIFTLVILALSERVKHCALTPWVKKTNRIQGLLM